MLSINAKSINDTSSTALLPSEFKELWKELTTEKIIDAFANFYDDQHLYIMLIQTTFYICQLEIQNSIHAKNDEILSILNIQNDNDKRSITNKIGRILQTYSKYIFQYDDCFLARIKKHLMEVLQSKFKSLLPSQEFCKLFTNGNEDSPSSNLEKMIEAEEFEDCIKILYSLCLNMELSDPPITIELMSFIDQQENSYC
ncbi:unnamed protein product [Moneuplotes crassus]|uniref:Uncharacterized protein n=1 Tax=Euplotes crassus TaxID=5936 RepID=A0AAD1TZH7_EUPCR|nr:unnamed protein product [Moneuplotes crassus]